MLHLLTFFAGVLFAVIVGVCGLKYYLKLKKRFGTPVWYKVECFDTVPQADGVFRMDFLLDGHVCRGYTKKCPPQGVKPEDLEVMVRTISSKRCLYRVFWRFKN